MCNFYVKYGHLGPKMLALLSSREATQTISCTNIIADATICNKWVTNRLTFTVIYISALGLSRSRLRQATLGETRAKIKKKKKKYVIFSISLIQ